MGGNSQHTTALTLGRQRCAANSRLQYTHSARLQYPPANPLKAGGGGGWEGGEGRRIQEEDGNATVHPEQSSPEELEEEREKEARSPGLRRGANQSGCHPLPGD